MATVLETTPTRKPLKAYFAHLYDEAGVITKVGGQVIFMRYEDGALIDFEPEMANFLVVLGECGIAQTQVLMDRLHGGAAAIACQRQMEVA